MQSYFKVLPWEGKTFFYVLSLSEVQVDTILIPDQKVCCFGIEILFSCLFNIKTDIR